MLRNGRGRKKSNEHKSELQRDWKHLKRIKLPASRRAGRVIYCERNVATWRAGVLQCDDNASLISEISGTFGFVDSSKINNSWWRRAQSARVALRFKQNKSLSSIGHYASGLCFDIVKFSLNIDRHSAPLWVKQIATSGSWISPPRQSS